MNNTFLNKKTDLLIISIIFFVFCWIFFIFFSEISKKNKIYNSKKIFYTVKNLLEKEVNHCRDLNKYWIYGQSCSEEISIEDFSNYFNRKQKLINPHSKNEGVGNEAGSVHLLEHEKILTLSIDIDANGGIDIRHNIQLN